MVVTFMSRSRIDARPHTSSHKGFASCGSQPPTPTSPSTELLTTSFGNFKARRSGPTCLVGRPHPAALPPRPPARGEVNTSPFDQSGGCHSSSPTRRLCRRPPQHGGEVNTSLSDSPSLGAGEG